MTDAILLVGESYSDQDLYYTTHFLAGDPFVFVRSGGRELLVTSSMEQGRARKESTVDSVKSFDDFGYRDLVRETGDRDRAFTAVLSRVLEDVGADRVVVQPTFPVLYADVLREGGATLDINPTLLRNDRRRKSEEEIQAIAEAQAAAERAAQHAIDIIAESEDLDGVLHYRGIPLTSERLRSEVEDVLVRNGMDVSQAPIVAGGPGAADPHWIGEGSLRTGEAVVLDIFPRSKRTRYWGDLTRTVVKGDPGDTLRAMYRTVLRAQEEALALIRAGANGADVHRAVEKVFEDAGFAGEGEGPRYIHSTGHGVGLDIHEGPNLASLDLELQEGDVVSVEPGLYDPTIGAIRIEDLVVVTAGGYRNLTSLPKQFEV